MIKDPSLIGIKVFSADMFREESRQAVHILFFIFAFALKYLDRYQAAFILILLLFVIVFILPKTKIKRFFHRHFEEKYSQGAALYFLVILFLLFFFSPSVVAPAWAILALGDGSATLFGKNFKTKPLPWNHKKSYGGSIAFLIFGFLGAFILLKWMMPDMGFGRAIQVSFSASLFSAFIESLPMRMDDNVTVALSAALVIFLSGV